MRAIHMAVIRRDLAMTKLLLDFGADTDGGIWPNRDATSPQVMARDRDYEEIVQAIRAANQQRGQRGPTGPTEATRKLHEAHLSGSEEAVVAVFEQHPELAETRPADGCTLLHQAAARGFLKLTEWLIGHGAAVNAKCPCPKGQAGD